MAQLTQIYGAHWWTSSDFLETLGRGKGIVLRAQRDIESRNVIVSSGRMTAELSFGFWTKMLLPKYDQSLWRDLRANFAYLPDGLARADLERRCEALRRLRNRISHHEPIFLRDLSKDYSDNLQLLRWLSPSKAQWIKPQITIMSLMRTRP